MLIDNGDEYELYYGNLLIRRKKELLLFILRSLDLDMAVDEAVAVSAYIGICGT